MRLRSYHGYLGWLAGCKGYCAVNSLWAYGGVLVGFSELLVIVDWCAGALSLSLWLVSVM